ncbi:cytoplasmic tRNA 2-thiolation protein 2, variant 2 [Orbilia javanica]|uniref:Cytoplasmic tRNA 2-thiolation protein 2, variant 2 n=1 Tax=Orbilia javanica TaxID=47235 RepID=A0AAN8MS47_9PEZI
MEFEITMADIANRPRPAAQNLCKRCKVNPPDITMRHEAICWTCFQIYIRTKFTRHMEPYKVKKGNLSTKKLLLATSLGVSSTVLLDTLYWHRSLQIERAKRSKYDVCVVHIDETAVTGNATNTTPDTAATTTSVDECIEKLKENYPQFEFIRVPLEEIYTISGNTTVEEIASTAAGLTLDSTSTSPSSSTPLTKLCTLLSSLNSRASQMDLINILRTRLLVEIAKQRNCEAIFFGDTMTKMAAMVLAEVTKGRGHALPWLISDGPTPYGTPFPLFPLLSLYFLFLLSPVLVAYDVHWNVVMLYLSQPKLFLLGIPSVPTYMPPPE